MDNRKQALTDLLAKVEAGVLKPVDLIVLEPDEHAWADRAYNGSLDAAMALHEAVLPNMKFLDILRRGNRYTSHISLDVFDNTASGVSSTPARAWLIAIIEALIAKGTE